MKFIKEFVNFKMDSCIRTFIDQLNTLRSSRISPAILDSIFIDYFGKKIQLKKLSNIVVENFNTLRITLFDNTLKNKVEKAIINSNLDLNPISIGNYFQIKIPTLTEERRLKLIKLAKNMAENGRICIRSVRRLSNEKVKLLLNNKVINNDTERKFQNEIQLITDNYIKKIDIMLREKEKDLVLI